MACLSGEGSLDACEDASRGRTRHNGVTAFRQAFDRQMEPRSQSRRSRMTDGTTCMRGFNHGAEI